MKKVLCYLHFIIISALFFKCSSPETTEEIESKSASINLLDANPDKFDSMFAVEEIIPIVG